ncbi:hypothetical protein AAES_130754 [Amazona aestiva]|uniref:Uncharacterized protein n=1 Tax=Amazona aestiva TaxID=12930 RepID=A0A0Q3P7S3_AMAAE|nr:hypothetical protein AAES_130754 [Amazona aestiva]
MPRAARADVEAICLDGLLAFEKTRTLNYFACETVAFDFRNEDLTSHKAQCVKIEWLYDIKRGQLAIPLHCTAGTAALFQASGPKKEILKILYWTVTE